MPRGTELSEEEKGKVWAFHEMGLSAREIGRRLNRTRTVVLNLIKLRGKYGSKKRSGRKPTLSDRQRREIFKCATNSNMSAGEIQRHLLLSISRRRVQQILHQDERLKYVKRNKFPKLTPRHKTARLNFAEKHQFWEEDWQSVIFSDEKKFNLDGPDGNQYHWQDTRKKPENRLARNFGGGSLMIWAAFGYIGKSPICFISCKMNSGKYIELLEDGLLNYADDMAPNSWIFQQDNAAIHSSRATKEFLRTCNVPVLEWPACSPDLNPIENVWALLAKKVYQKGRQFESVRDLKEAILVEWANIDQSILQNLINSMPRRMQQVIIKKGGNTTY